MAVLEPWNADAFFVSQLVDTAADAEAANAARLMLGPRLRLAVQGPARELYDPQEYAAAINGSGARVSRGPNVGGVAGYAGFINQLLNRESCLRLVLHAEAASRHTCTHAHAHAHAHAHMHASMHACMHTYMHTRMHTCMHTRMHTCMHTCTHT